MAQCSYFFENLKKKKFRKHSWAGIEPTTEGLKHLSAGVLTTRPAEARIGRDAFFEPEIETLPLTLQGPFIKNLSINYFFILATWIVVCPWYLPFFDL